MEVVTHVHNDSRLGLVGRVNTGSIEKIGTMVKLDNPVPSHIHSKNKAKSTLLAIAAKHKTQVYVQFENNLTYADLEQFFEGEKSLSCVVYDSRN